MLCCDLQEWIQLLSLCLWADWSRQVLLYDRVRDQSRHSPHGLLENIRRYRTQSHQRKKIILTNSQHARNLQRESPRSLRPHQQTSSKRTPYPVKQKNRSLRVRDYKVRGPQLCRDRTPDGGRRQEQVTCFYVDELVQLEGAYHCYYRVCAEGVYYRAVRYY